MDPPRPIFDSPCRFRALECAYSTVWAAAFRCSTQATSCIPKSDVELTVLTLHCALHDGRPGFRVFLVLTGACQFGHGVGGFTTNFIHSPPLVRSRTPSTVRPLARDPRVLVGWPLPLGFGLGGCLLLARRGRVCVQFIIIIIISGGVVKPARERGAVVVLFPIFPPSPLRKTLRNSRFGRMQVWLIPPR